MVKNYTQFFSFVDIAGIITSVGELLSVKSRKDPNIDIPKRYLIITDFTKETLAFQTFGDRAVTYGQLLKPGMALCIQNAVVNEWSGITAQMVESTRVNIDQRHKKARELLEWYNGSNGK